MPHQVSQDTLSWSIEALVKAAPGIRHIACALLVSLLAACTVKKPEPPFANIEGASVNVREFVIIARVYLSELPALLPYNAPGLAENRLEYEWRVSFDADGDDTRANDIDLVLARFKFPGSEPGEGSVTDFGQHFVVRVDATGRGVSVIAASRVWQEGDTLVFGVSKSEHEELLAIDHSTPWRVQTYFDPGSGPSVAYYPANGGYFLPQ